MCSFYRRYARSGNRLRVKGYDEESVRRGSVNLFDRSQKNDVKTKDLILEVFSQGGFPIGFVKVWVRHQQDSGPDQGVLCTARERLLLPRRPGLHLWARRTLRLAEHECAHWLDEKGNDGVFRKLNANEPLAFSGAHITVTERQDRLLREAFPGTDCAAEYPRADAWLEAHPERMPRKSADFIHYWFIQNWLGIGFHNTFRRYVEPQNQRRRPWTVAAQRRGLSKAQDQYILEHQAQ
jgi:hypothetical protein